MARYNYAKVWIDAQVKAVKALGEKVVARKDNDGNIYIVLDGTRMFKIPATYAFLDAGRFDQADTIKVWRNANAANSFPAFFTGNARVITRNGKKSGTVLEVKGDNGVITWLDERYVKEFGGAENLVCRISDKKNAPVILESVHGIGPELGLVCPVNMDVAMRTA